MSLSPRRSLFVLAVFSAVPLLVACPKKDEPVPPEAAPPPPVPEAAVTELVPLEEDAGLDAGADADAGKKLTGTGVPTNVARLKQCCNQLSVQAKAMPNTPEGGMFQQAAAQCNTMASSLGPNASAPEMGAIKMLLAGRNIPAVCAGF
jgi:hypothetical protein